MLCLLDNPICSSLKEKGFHFYDGVFYKDCIADGVLIKYTMKTKENLGWVFSRKRTTYEGEQLSFFNEIFHKDECDIYYILDFIDDFVNY